MMAAVCNTSTISRTVYYIGNVDSNVDYNIAPKEPPPYYLQWLLTKLDYNILYRSILIKVKALFRKTRWRSGKKKSEFHYTPIRG